MLRYAIFIELYLNWSKMCQCVHKQRCVHVSYLHIPDLSRLYTTHSFLLHSPQFEHVVAKTPGFPSRHTIKTVYSTASLVAHNVN